MINIRKAPVNEDVFEEVQLPITNTIPADIYIDDAEAPNLDTGLWERSATDVAIKDFENDDDIDHLRAVQIKFSRWWSCLSIIDFLSQDCARRRIKGIHLEGPFGWTPEEWKALAAAINAHPRPWQQVDLSSIACPYIGEAFLAPVLQGNKVLRLKIEDVDTFWDEVASSLARCKSLGKISFKDQSMIQIGGVLKAMAHNESVKSIRFDDCKLDPSSIRLWLSGLEGNTSVRNIFICRSVILCPPDYGLLGRILDASPRLESLGAVSINVDNDHFLNLGPAVAAHSSLRDLVLRLSLDGFSTFSIFDCLSECTTLQSLEIEGDINDDGALVLGQYLATTKSLTWLDLGTWGIPPCTPRSVGLITRGLALNTTLTMLPYGLMSGHLATLTEWALRHNWRLTKLNQLEKPESLHEVIQDEMGHLSMDRYFRFGKGTIVKMLRANADGTRAVAAHEAKMDYLMRQVRENYDFFMHYMIVDDNFDCLLDFLRRDPSNVSRVFNYFGANVNCKQQGVVDKWDWEV